MLLTELLLYNFRIHKNFSIPIKEELCIFTGSNGIGKTTILEAISILGSVKSFRVAKNLDFILKGAEKSELKAKTKIDTVENSIHVEILSHSKKVFVNNKAIKRQRQVSEILPHVVFSPMDHQIINGDASDRRHFINKAFSNISFQYADGLENYNHVLRQRNQLLKLASKNNMNKSHLVSQIEPWDNQLLHYGQKIIDYRAALLNELEQYAKQEYIKIAATSDQLSIKYLPFGKEKIQENFEKYLKETLSQDILFGTTNIGPHKDDFMLSINGNHLKYYGSQGEKRTSVLALRLGEVALFQNARNINPILLLDDVSSELDKMRRQALVDLLRNRSSQVFLTATELPADLLQDVERGFMHWDLNKMGVV